MSQPGGAEGQPCYRPDEGEIVPEPYDPNMPRLRGGHAPAHSYNINGNAGQWPGPSEPATGIGYGHLQNQSTQRCAVDEFYEVPADDIYAARGGHHQYGPAPGRGTQARAFDFNDQGQPNPWQGAAPQPQRPREPEYQRGPEYQREPEALPKVMIFHVYRFNC